jgi:hypothetical protein
MLIKTLLLFVLAAAMALTWLRVRQGVLTRVVALFWSILWAGAALIVLLPDLASDFASLVGVGRGADAVVYLSVIFLFYLVFRIFLRLDKIDRDITVLVRKIGLAEDERKGSEDPRSR